MINIKAESKGDHTELAIKIDGSGENIIYEAVAVMCNLPKPIKEMSTPLFLRFLAELAESDTFGVAERPHEEANDDDQ